MDIYAFCYMLLLLVSFKVLLAGGVSQFQQSNFSFILTLINAKDDVDLCRELDMDEIR